MSEKQTVDKRRILMYVLAVIVIAAIAWVVLRGMNIFRYAETFDREIEAQQESEAGE